MISNLDFVEMFGQFFINLDKEVKTSDDLFKVIESLMYLSIDEGLGDIDKSTRLVSYRVEHSKTVMRLYHRYVDDKDDDGIFACAIHDLFKLTKRENHALLASKFLVELGMDKDSWIVEAIKRHSEKKSKHEVNNEQTMLISDLDLMAGYILDPAIDTLNKEELLMFYNKKRRMLFELTPNNLRFNELMKIIYIAFININRSTITLPHYTIRNINLSFKETLTVRDIVTAFIKVYNEPINI